MRLSELVYESVRDSISIPSEKLNYYAFVNEIASGNTLDRNWALQLSTVFNSINLAIARLLTSDKIEHFSKTVVVVNGNLVFADGSLLKIVNLLNGMPYYQQFQFRKLGNGNFFVEVPMGNHSMQAEFVKAIPHFDLSATGNSEWAIKPISIGGTDDNKDLSELGINNTMCDYIKEFAKGQCLEVVDPEMANLHNSRAEAYFSSLPVAEQIYPQRNVINMQKGWVD